MKLLRLAAVVSAAVSLAAGALTAGAAGPAAAQGQFDKPKYASIVVDANSGEVLYALHADEQRYPASITKIMTLYLTFEALATGRLSLEDRVPFSGHAAAQAPSKIGVPAGGDISVGEAIQAAAVMSANDAAVALAEKIGGSEQRFASLMTLRGQELGMRRSRFVNANGLPDSRQITSARDIAVLSRAVMRDYPQYYHYFNQRAFSWRGRTTLNHNRLLLRMPGMDGLKTGFTNAAGFNLAASAVRDGRRLITVVLGGSSSAARNENVETLLQAGFDVIDRRARGQTLTLASLLSEPEDAGGSILRPPVEMGSGEQAGLQVVTAAAAPPAGARPLQLARLDAPAPSARFAAAPRPSLVRASATARSEQLCETVTVRRRHHRRVREERCHSATPAQVAAAAPDCRHEHGGRLRACRAEAREMRAVVARAEPAASDCAGLHGRRLKTCRGETHAAILGATSGSTSVAKAQPLSPDCAKARGRKARGACRSDGDGGAKATTTARAEGGAYMIQVGAFGSRSDAQAHLSKLSHSHASLFGGASEQVETAGRAYRARFAGLSKAEARSACTRLAAQGERCMVVAR